MIFQLPSFQSSKTHSTTRARNTFSRPALACVTLKYSCDARLTTTGPRSLACSLLRCDATVSPHQA